MDDYHEELGRIGGFILSSNDTLNSEVKFTSNGETYKGYRINRDGAHMNVVSPDDSTYINVEIDVSLSRQFGDAVDEDVLSDLYSEYPQEVTSGMSDHDMADYHLRQSLVDVNDESTLAARQEMEELIDDPDVRIDWKTYSDTDLLDGFILYTRLFPDALSLEAYDAAVNRISHYGKRLDDELRSAFGGFIEEVQSEAEEQPTGGGDDSGPSGRSFA